MRTASYITRALGSVRHFAVEPLKDIDHAFETCAPPETKYYLGKIFAGMAVGNVLTTVPHELLHYRAGELLGAQMGKIRIPVYLGGGWWERAFPDIFKSFVPAEFTSNPFSWLQLGGAPVERTTNEAYLWLNLAPYPLQLALGWYLVKDGIRRKSLCEVSAGFVNLGAPFMGAFGDIRNASYAVVDLFTEGLRMGNIRLNDYEQVEYSALGMVAAYGMYKTSKTLASWVESAYASLAKTKSP